MILLIDNYDSFSYNLAQLAGSIAEEGMQDRREGGSGGQRKRLLQIVRNDAASVEEVLSWKPSHILLSPGPKRPEQAGICIDLIKAVKGRVPILGVCLGHQGICMAYGAEITYAGQLMHGKQSRIKTDNTSRLFDGLPEYMDVARYHSLAAGRQTIPAELKITAETEEGEVMAVEHKEYPVFGVQFHPESILTPMGAEIMRNFLNVRCLDD